MLFRQIGGKFKVARELMSLFPLEFREYREPFCGNCSFLWYLPTDLTRWMNDKNPDVVRFLLALRDDPEFHDRIREMQDIEDATGLHRRFRRAKYEWKHENDTYAHLFLNRLAHCQLVQRKRPNVASFGWSHLRNGIEPLSPSRCETARQLMQGVRITNMDYSNVILADGYDVFLFLDPPYWVGKHDLYDFSFTVRQHHDLRDYLRETPHRFLMTIGWCELTHKLYWQDAHFNVSIRRYQYCGTIRGHEPQTPELIVMNY